MFLETKKLKYFNLGKEGSLFEALRSDDSFYGGKFGQNLVSVVAPGVKKGLHLHKEQTEYTTCVQGNLLYVAIKKKGKKFLLERHILGEKERIMIKMPPGIWHGYTALEGKSAIVLHTMDKPYDPLNPDTLEKDPDSFFKECGNIWEV